MPIVYRIDHDHRLVLVRGHGSLTDDDVFGYQRSVWSRQDVAGYSELVDVTEVTEIKLPSVQRLRDLASLAASMDDQSSSSRLGIVAPPKRLRSWGSRTPPPLPDVHEEITRISD